MGQLRSSDARIPISRPDIGERERKYLLEAYDSGWISSKGKFIDQFEDKFAEWLGVNYAITTSSGTTALHLAVLAAGVKRNEYVYVTPGSYKACSNAVEYVGAFTSTAFPNQWNILVHNYGYFNKEVIHKAYTHIIEDAAEALGTRFGDRKVGTFGEISVFSFFGNKTLSTGEGGMICTNNLAYAKKIRHLKNQAMIEPYVHDQVGYNYRMTNLQAAIGCAQLERVEELLEKKRRVSKWYDKYLSSEERAFKPYKCSDPVLWMNIYRVKNQIKFMKVMDENGIETRPGFDSGQEIVCLPSSTTLTEAEVKEVCDTANRAGLF